MRTFLSRRLVAVMLTALALFSGPMRAAADEITVFAAGSLTGVLDRVAEAWTEATGHRVSVSYANSAALARQIQDGAPADVFISANIDWMDTVEASGDIRPDTRRNILGNTLVLIAHGRDVQPVTIDETLDLVGLLDGGRLAMPLIDAAPAGIYARAALTLFGLWDDVAPFVAQSDTVRTTMAFVARGEAPLGIVYATDAALEENVTIIGVFPDGSHERILYPAAVTTVSTSAHAPAFLDFLTSDAARAIWEDFGFTVLD